MTRRVVVTGLGAVTALGCKVEKLWARICQGESGVSPIERLNLEGYRVRFGGEIHNWSPNGYIEAKDIKRFDRFVQFAQVAGVDAVRDSGIEFSKENPWRGGVILGSGIGGLETIEIQHKRLLDRGPDKISAFTIPKLIGNAASAAIGHRIRPEGAKPGGGNRLRERYERHRRRLQTNSRRRRRRHRHRRQRGRFDAHRPQRLQRDAALSERNDEPTRASRPFDRDRDGFVLSEGAGLAVLEEYEHAVRRGARIYGEVYGYGCSCDGGHITAPDKDGVAAAHAMALAIKDARINASDIDYINAHGTSTSLGDQAETTAIKSVFKEHAKQVSISSTKSQLGHLLGASGGVELVLCLLAIRDGLIPPTINYEHPDPLCDLDYTPNQARQREVSLAMSNSFGFGGHNGSLIFGKLRRV